MAEGSDNLGSVTGSERSESAGPPIATRKSEAAGGHAKGGGFSSNHGIELAKTMGSPSPKGATGRSIGSGPGHGGGRGHQRSSATAKNAI
jgi:hypothetical protein